jgi:NAD-dependent dihydropyrimidine dehydrogenase PreA subunit
MKRKIININADKCNGCGLCMPDCPEGALRIIEGKARLISDLFCDGLGACIGSCPQDAITVLEREAEPYDEKLVMANIVPQGEPVVIAHLEHLQGHGETKLYNEAIEYLKENNLKIPKTEMQHAASSCSGSAAQSILREPAKKQSGKDAKIESELRQWPVQLKLLNPSAPYFDNTDLLIAADCTPFAYGNFHRDFLAGKTVIMFCPKLDPYIDEYVEKMTAILSNHDIKSITVLRMEVPCCGGVNYVLDQALEKSGKKIPVTSHIISTNGEVK